MLINRHKNTSCRRGVALRGFASLSDVLTTTAATASAAQTRLPVLRHSLAAVAASHVFLTSMEMGFLQTGLIAIQLLACNEFEGSPPPRFHLSAGNVVFGDSRGCFFRKRLYICTRFTKFDLFFIIISILPVNLWKFEKFSIFLLLHLSPNAVNNF